MPKPVASQEDDDPTPYLFVSLEQRRIDQSKPYDSKKNCWIPDEKEGYLLGEIKATKGDIVSVGLPGGEVKINCFCLFSTSYNTTSKQNKQKNTNNIHQTFFFYETFSFINHKHNHRLENSKLHKFIKQIHQNSKKSKIWQT